MADTEMVHVVEIRKRADEGDAEAQDSLGWCYEFGIGGAPQDDAEAVKWYRLAADQGNPSGRRILASCYEFGEGVPKDLIEADKWYRPVPGQGRDFSERSAG